MEKRKRHTTIEGLSDRFRLPRYGKIRLGIKKKSDKTGKEYPSAVDFFVCPEEVLDVYGDQPRELEVLIPAEDPADFFPQSYKYYRSGIGLFCNGDGVTANRIIEETSGMEELTCPCEFLEQPNKCRRMANLQVILPRVALGGVYQIDTSSINSIIDINSGIAYIQKMVGHLAMVPAILKLGPRETTVNGRKKIVWTMTLTLPNHEQVRELREGLSQLQLICGNAPPALPEPSVELDHIPVSEHGNLIEVVTVPGTASESSTDPDFSQPEISAPELSDDSPPLPATVPASVTGALADEWRRTLPLAYGKGIETERDFLGFAACELKRAVKGMKDLTVADWKVIHKALKAWKPGAMS